MSSIPHPDHRLKVAILGSGALGGYFGGRLAQAGEDVTFIARGRQLAAMREAGLRIESPRGDLNLQAVRVTDDPRTIGRVDLVLFTVKLWSTEEAGRQLAPLIGRDTAVISLQNGVDANGILAGLVGREHLMGGLCYIAATAERPGVVKHTGQMARLVFGELDRKKTLRADAFLAACARAKTAFDAELSPDIERAIWEKFVFIVGLSALTSLTRRSIGPVRSDPDTRAMLLDVMREAVAVGRAKGTDLAPDFAEKRLAFVDTLPPEMTSSMHNDLERGNRLEVAWLSGAVVRLGREAGVPTPANQAVYTALKLHAAGGASAPRSG
jgi:2-dehydropantoate 2-reductase